MTCSTGFGRITIISSGAVTEGAEFLYLNFPVSSYEGGGYSESRENAERDRREHRMITGEYMSRGELLAIVC